MHLADLPSSGTVLLNVHDLKSNFKQQHCSTFPFAYTFFLLTPFQQGVSHWNVHSLALISACLEYIYDNMHCTGTPAWNFMFATKRGVAAGSLKNECTQFALNHT